MKRIACLAVLWCCAFLCADNVFAQAAYTRFLVPLYVPDTPGAYGSLWQVRTWIHYRGTAEPAVVPAPYCYGTVCGGSANLYSYWPVVPLQASAGFPEPALLLHIDTAAANDVRISSRVRDLSRAADSAGTEIPVIREDRMPSASLALVNVPVERRFRTMLRVYALPDVAGPEVEIRYYRQPASDGPNVDFTPRLLKSQVIPLRMRQVGDGINLVPALAEIAGVESFPELANETAVWVEVVPRKTGMRVWALASVTNNTTQQVTIISPNE